MNIADVCYYSLIGQVLEYGDLIETRNHAAYSLIDSDTIIFHKTPLVTLRKTAWRKALREMEWFLSGDPKCPVELLDWWDGQLSKNQCYYYGYGDQLRNFDYTFDQIQSLLEGIKAHPYSRRHVITTWNPREMSIITKVNGNQKTPTTCHGTIIQYFVRNGKLSARTYQRSCDVILGCIHNWIQHWALLMWLAHQTSLEVGSLIWDFGDLHLYAEESHLEVARAILASGGTNCKNPKLIYKGTGDFKASDFELDGLVNDPVSTVRPKLL